jgi:hypothetical protein
VSFPRFLQIANLIDKGLYVLIMFYRSLHLLDVVMCYEDVHWRCALVKTRSVKYLQIMFIQLLQECPEYTLEPELVQRFCPTIVVVLVVLKERNKHDQGCRLDE